MQRNREAARAAVCGRRPFNALLAKGARVALLRCGKPTARHCPERPNELAVLHYIYCHYNAATVTRPLLTLENYHYCMLLS